MTWLPARPPGWGTLPRCSVGNPSPPSSWSCGGSSPRTAAPGDGGRAPPRGAGDGGRPCGGFRVSSPGVFCLRLYCSMAYLCHRGLPGVYVTLWARIRYKTASFLASSSSGQLGALGCRSIPIARQPVMVGLWGALSPSLSGIVRFPRLPVYVPCPLPGSASSLRRPRPLSLEVVSEAGVWVLLAIGVSWRVGPLSGRRARAPTSLSVWSVCVRATLTVRSHLRLWLSLVSHQVHDSGATPAHSGDPGSRPRPRRSAAVCPRWVPDGPPAPHGKPPTGAAVPASSASPAPAAPSRRRPPAWGRWTGLHALGLTRRLPGTCSGDRGGQMRLAAGDVSGPLRLEQERDL